MPDFPSIVLSTGTGERFMRFPAVQAATGLSRTSIWQMIRDGKFPAPVSLNSRNIAWRESEVKRWQDQRPRVNYAPPQPAAA
jgi:prophage regulatory protein